MLAPDYITVKVTVKEGDQVKEVAHSLPYEYNFNASNAYRKYRNLSNEDFVQLFAGLSEANLDSNEMIGELLWYAIKEGHRILKEPMPDISIEDVARYINSDQQIFIDVLKRMKKEHPDEDEDEKKKLDPISWDDIEVMALGRMGMTSDELGLMTPRRLSNKIKGWQREKEQEMAIQRALTYSVMLSGGNMPKTFRMESILHIPGIDERKADPKDLITEEESKHLIEKWGDVLPGYKKMSKEELLAYNLNHG